MSSNTKKDIDATQAVTILEQYKHIVDDTTIVSKSDLNGIITYANKQFVEISGYSEKELLGKPHSILRDPYMPSSTFKELWKTIKAKKVWSGVITNIRKDGSKYTVKASIFPILDSAGDIIEYIAIRHDITELRELNSKIKALREYDIQQQHAAREKLEAGIVNQADTSQCKILYNPSDILSGDFYSIFKCMDGKTFIYILDGQGHGVSPALTVFAVSATIKQSIHRLNDFDALIEELFPTVKTFLGEIEQLSYTMIMIDNNKNTLSYVSGGMYPFLIKTANGVERIKANNRPFMNFSELPVKTEINFSNIESVFLYSDGIVEHENNDFSEFTPENLINKPLLINKAIKKMSNYNFEDDMTFVYYENVIKKHNN